MTKTVFFDLGNVVLYFSHDKMCRQVARYCGTDETFVREKLLHTSWNEKYEIGDIDSWALFHELTANCPQQKEFSRLMEAMSNIFEPNDSILPLIKELKRNQVKLYILSNTCEAHFNYAYTHFPVLHLFDGYVLSYEAKSRKPDRKIFEYALSKADCKPNNCFYIDDMLEYVEGARALGIDAEQYISSDELLKQLTSREFLPNNPIMG